MEFPRIYRHICRQILRLQGAALDLGRTNPKILLEMYQMLAHEDEWVRTAANADVAGAGGFEPPYGGIKIHCLTTWRRPNRPAGEWRDDRLSAALAWQR